MLIVMDHSENSTCVSGADPGFQVRGGGALKKIAPSEGRRENCWGISCEKSRFYAKKIIFFPILGGRAPGAPSLDPHLLDHFTKLPKHTYTRPEEADVTSICNFDFVVTIVIVQMCLAFKKGLSRSLQERLLDYRQSLKKRKFCSELTRLQSKC